LRSKIVFGLLLVMLVAFAALLFLRERPSHMAPAPPGESGATPGAVPVSDSTVAVPVEATGAGPSAADGGSIGDAGALAEGGSPVDAGPVKLLDRPLRVVTMGWDLAAPGLLVNGGTAPSASSEFAAAGLDVHIASVDSMAAIEGAMARGGADKDGADIVVVPMPAFVASYERLRALSPEIFFVVGFSRGRDGLVSSRDPALERPAKGDLKLAGAPGDAATFLSLFVLDLAGIPPTDVKLAPPDSKPDDAPLAAIDRGTDDLGAGRRSLVLTTADAPRLVPFVAASPRGLLEKSGRAVAAWARVWLTGTQKLAADAPAGARQVAAVQGAPEPLSLLKRLGQSAPATLGDNVRIAGLSGRGALTLEVLFQRTWQLWRGVGVLATPAPEVTPVSNAVIAALARSDPQLVDPPSGRSGAGSESEGGKKGAAPDKGKPLFVSRMPEGKLDEEGFVNAVGLIAGVFERSQVRVAVHQGGGVDTGKTKKMIERVEGRFDVPAGRLVPAKGALGKGAAAAEVLAVP
jgi:hypothetical protein